MWRAGAFEDGSWREVPVIAVDGEPFSSEGLLGVARARPELNDSRLVGYLAQEAEHALGRRSAIETWAQTAIAQSNEFDWAQPVTLARFDDAIGLLARDAASAPTPFTLAWHDRTAVIVPFTGNEERVLMEYVPDLREEQRVERLRHRHASDAHRMETVFEWRGYFGRQSDLGTPLAAMGGRLMNVLFHLGEDFAGAIPLVSPLTKAFGYLYDAPGLPPGIDAMREDSAALSTLNTIGDRSPVRSWGGAFDILTAPSGFGVGVAFA